MIYKRLDKRLLVYTKEAIQVIYGIGIDLIEIERIKIFRIKQNLLKEYLL